MSAKEKINRVTVNIAHDEYIIKGCAEPRYIEKVASSVDAHMKQLTLNNPMLSMTKVAVLAALNVTDELFRLKKDYDDLIKLLNEAQDDMNKRV